MQVNVSSPYWYVPVHDSKSPTPASSGATDCIYEEGRAELKSGRPVLQDGRGPKDIVSFIRPRQI